MQEKEGEVAGEVQIIDFEYGAFTFAAFDLGNHFNEYAGFECEYARFPDHEHITHFAREYLEEASTQPVVRPYHCVSPIPSIPSSNTARLMYFMF